MTENIDLIEKFYSAFQKKDFRTMQESYHPEAVFNDEAFKNLNGIEAGKMWEMLITRGKDLELKYEVLKSTENTVEARWIAKYTFSKTKRLVVNDIRANFVIESGKIIQHTDRFNFYTWARQAFGLTGMLLGWTPFFRNKVQKTAMQSLKIFIDKT